MTSSNMWILVERDVDSYGSAEDKARTFNSQQSLSTYLETTGNIQKLKNKIKIYEVTNSCSAFEFLFENSK